MFHRVCIFVCMLAMGSARADDPAAFDFTRMVAHWAKYGDGGYLSFIDDAEPELVQLGFYGGHFWSLAHTPQYKGYPAHFPVQGLDECADWFADKNRSLRRRNVKVVGHFNVEFLVGEPDGPDGPRGFFKFYRELWDEKLLGPKPVDDPLELLERGADGTPIIHNSYKIGGMHEYWACLRNPHWQTVLKAWVKRGIDLGLDGFIANYFYRHNCLCEHCQSSFRKYLAMNHSSKALQDRFGIANLDRHKFDELVCWHDPNESTPLRLEMLRWSQISNKQVFDEVLVRHGRSLKPDLLVAQWNHLGNFSQIRGDERCLLPAELWSKDESYLWYSAGGSAFYTDLENNFAGDVTLQARYIRGASGDKPFTIGKYENTRIRSAIAELAANGGAPMGFYTRFTDPAARAEIVRYYQFLKKYDQLFKTNTSHAEVLLLFPRRSVHEGRVEDVQRFRDIGKQLLDQHVLFDVLPDDLATSDVLSRYDHIYRPSELSGNVERPKATSRFDAPWSVRVAASRPQHGRDLTLHFVNYHREEPPKAKNGRPSAGRGAEDEKPIAVDPIEVDVVVAGGAVNQVAFMTPEHPKPISLEFTQAKGRVRFTVPSFLVYGLANIDLRSN